MEPNHLPFSSTGEILDDSCFTAMFSGVSLQSFLTVNHNPSLIGAYTADSFYFPATSNPSSDALILPKTEPLNPYELQTESLQIQSFDFLHETSSLPDLYSLEQPPLMAFNKRARVDSPLNPLQSFDSVLRTRENCPYQLKNSLDSTATVQIPRSALARQRRQKLSDKTRCLQKLLPWDKKMDIATMLEETYKYVKFLQAQLVVLQSMPSESAISTGLSHCNSGSNGGGFSELERLNRNQLLQVLVNSPVAQTMLCSQSRCVFSAEQLGLIQNITEKRVFQQMSAFRSKP